MQRTSLKWRLAQFLEIRWWRRYWRQQNRRDYLQRKRRYWQQIFHALNIEIPQQQRVLEFGCGPAGAFIVLEQCILDAVDPLIHEYAHALAGFSFERYPWVRFHAEKMEDFTPTSSFPLILCMNAINHVDDWHAAIRQRTVAAAAGTTLLLGVDVHRYQALKQLFRQLPGDLLHPHQHDRDDYRQALADEGWIIEGEHSWKKGRIFDYWLLKATYPS